MRFPWVTTRGEEPGEAGPDERIYASLDPLVRLQFQARGYTFLPRQPNHSLLAGRRSSRVRGRGLDFEELRGYLPGDDTRTIDWRVTARTGKPFVRVYTEERDRPGLLVVDQRINMFFGSRVNLKSVTAAHAAALAAWRIFDAGDRVGALVFDDRDVAEITPHRSRARVMAILRAIVAKNNALSVNSDITPAPEKLNETLERAVRLAKHDHLVAVISDFESDADETRRLLVKLAAHNDVIAAMVVDPMSMAEPPEGRFVISDGQLQVELETGDTAKIWDFFGDRQRRTAEVLRSIGVPMLTLMTDEDVAPQVRRQFGAR